LYLFALYSFGKDKYFKKKTTLFYFTYLVKGTAALGRALRGCWCLSHT